MTEEIPPGWRATGDGAYEDDAGKWRVFQNIYGEWRIYAIPSFPTAAAAIAAAEILSLRKQLAEARDAALEEAAILMETETAPPNEYDQFPSVTKMVRKAGQKDRGERIRALKGQKP